MDHPLGYPWDEWKYFPKISMTNTQIRLQSQAHSSEDLKGFLHLNCEYLRILGKRIKFKPGLFLFSLVIVPYVIFKSSCPRVSHKIVDNHSQLNHCLQHYFSKLQLLQLQKQYEIFSTTFNCCTFYNLPRTQLILLKTKSNAFISCNAGHLANVALKGCDLRFNSVPS